MMNVQNENLVNGQSESDDIDLGHDQQGVTEEAQRVADSIVQALDRTDSEGGKWKQRFEKKWGCQVFVQCEPQCGTQPLQVALVVVPDFQEVNPDLVQISVRVNLSDVQDADGVWPALRSKTRRLTQNGRVLKYVRDVLGLVCTGDQDLEMRSLFNACNCYLRDGAGFEMFVESPSEARHWKPFSDEEGKSVTPSVAVALRKWLDEAECDISQHTKLLQNDLSLVKFYSDHSGTQTWRYATGGLYLSGRWSYREHEGVMSVFLYFAHKVELPLLWDPLGRRIFLWDMELSVPLMDHNFLAETGTLEILAGLGLPPVFRPEVHVSPEVSDIAGLDFNIGEPCTSTPA